jgi:hypothetical protein
VTKRAFKRHRKRVRRYLRAWMTQLGLNWWHIEMHWYDREKQFRKADKGLAVMRIWARWQYLDATIAVNLPAVARMTDDELERAVLHELCHALVNEMRTESLDLAHEERVVTTLTAAFMWTREFARGER